MSSHHVAVGTSTEVDSALAGARVITRALEHIALDASQIKWVWLFCGAEHDAETLLKSALEHAGPQARVFGGSCMGVVSSEGISYQGYEAAAVVFAGEGWQMDAVSVDGVNLDEDEAGFALGKKLLEFDENLREKALFLLYDSIRESSSPPSLNMATYLLQGMSRALGKPWPMTTGLGVIADNLLSRLCVQFFERGVHTQQAMAQIIGGNVRIKTDIVHGYRPISTYHTVTEVDGNVVLEIDDKPATQVASAWLPGEDLMQPMAIFPVTLGMNRGDKFGPFVPSNYQNRMSLGVDAERHGLIMFEPDLKAGDQVQFMRQHISADQVQEQCTALLDGLEGTPLFVFYIDCGGRVAARVGTEEEEALGLIRACEGRCPYLGCYSGVEIARVGAGETPLPLDLTGVLCVFELVEDGS